jgi:hypothetical protein
MFVVNAFVSAAIAIISGHYHDGYVPDGGSRRTTHAYDTTIVAACPKCRVSLKLLRSSIPQFDSCGFENYFLQCESCQSSLAGVIEPINEELLISLIEPAIDVATRPKERLDYQTKPVIGYAEKSVLTMLVSKQRG